MRESRAADPLPPHEEGETAMGVGPYSAEHNIEGLVRALASATEALEAIRCNSEPNTVGCFPGGYEGHIKAINDRCRAELFQAPEGHDA